MKTVKKWFETIKDEDVRRRALANCDPELINELDPTLADALMRNFSWCESPEGHAYWSEQHNKALNNEL